MLWSRQWNKIRKLNQGYISDIDTVNEETWCRLLDEFDDANIYQTWSYAAATPGRGGISHLILRNHQDIVAIAQVKISKLPICKIGIAYIRWGPLLRGGVSERNIETFRQSLRALRNEYSCRRGLVVRLVPAIYDDAPPCISSVLAEEGFMVRATDPADRTILMDLSPPLGVLRQGMNAHWKRELKSAERNRMDIVEGTSDELFGAFIRIYNEMVSRKQFVSGSDINVFRTIQSRLSEKLKMKIMLCSSGDGLCAGLIYSALGRTALYLYGATSNVGMKSNGSYLLQWKLIERLKKDGRTVYDLNGINPRKNPGTYKFKVDLAGIHGREVSSLGIFDSKAGLLSCHCIELASWFRRMSRELTKLTGKREVRAARVQVLLSRTHSSLQRQFAKHIR